MEENKLKNSPRQIYNCDETFVPLDCTRKKVVTLKKAKNTYMQAQGTSEHITILCAASHDHLLHASHFQEGSIVSMGQMMHSTPRVN